MKQKKKSKVTSIRTAKLTKKACLICQVPTQVEHLKGGLCPPCFNGTNFKGPPFDKVAA